MQLTGPLKLNSYSLYAAKDTPVEALWTDEREKSGRLVEALDGTKKYIGPKRYRGRFRFGFDGLTTNEALRVLYELRQGTLNLTPRTSQGGGGGIDITGDGVLDLTLEEVSIPVRVVSGLPSTSELYRLMEGGKIAHRIEVECESIQTYEEIPGLDTPTILEFRVFHTQGEDYKVEIYTGNVGMQIDWTSSGTFADVGSSASYVYDGSAGEQRMKVLFLQDEMDRLDMVARNADDGNFGQARILVSDDSGFATDFSDLTVQIVDLGGAVSTDYVQGTISPQNEFSSVGEYALGHATHAASGIPRDVDEIFGRGATITGNVMELPSDMKKVFIEVMSGFGGGKVIAAGGPVGPSTTLFHAASSGITLDADDMGQQFVGAAPTPIRNLQDFEPTRSQRRIDELHKAARSLSRFEAFRNGLKGDDFRGQGVMPPNIESWSASRIGWGVSPYPFLFDDYSFAQGIGRFVVGNYRRNDQVPHLINTEESTDYYNQERVLGGYYTQRSGLRSDTTLSVRLQDGYDRRGHVCALRSADTLWKTVGLHDHHPDHSSSGSAPTNTLDAVQSLTLSNMIVQSVQSTTTNTITVKLSLEAAGTNDDTAPDYAIRDSNNDLTDKVGLRLRHNSGTVEASVFRSTNTPEYIPLFQTANGHDNRYVRLKGEDTNGNPVDRQYIVSSHNYDAGAGELTITIDDTATADGVSTSIPDLTDGKMIHPFYFETRP